MSRIPPRDLWLHTRLARVKRGIDIVQVPISHIEMRKDKVRSFLGLANYFRKFIRDYANIASPLTDLLKGITATDKKGRLLHWGKLSADAAREVEQSFDPKWAPCCAHTFEQLKQALVSAPVLALPDFSPSFTVVCDACIAAPAIVGVWLKIGTPSLFVPTTCRDAKQDILPLTSKF